MAKVIALRFDTIKEVSTLKTLIEVGLSDPMISPREKKEGEELLKTLNGCAELFLDRDTRTVDDAGVDVETGKVATPSPDIDYESSENKRFAGSMQDDTQAMNASACKTCDD